MNAADIKADDVLGWAKEKMDTRRLPLPKKPRGRDPQFDFPDDPDALGSNELGQLMMRMASYLGYTQRLLGIADSELALVEAEYRLRVNTAGLEARERLGRVAADVVEAAVLAENGDLVPLYERRLRLMTVCIQLKSRLSMYEKFYQALSRELSRREMESRAS